MKVRGATRWCAAVALSALAFLSAGATHAAAGSPTWTVERIKTLNNAQMSTVNAVGAWSPQDVWAVGGYQTQNGTGQELTLAMRFNGIDWTVYHSPNDGQNNNVLTGITIISPSDIWAVGYYSDVSGSNQPLTEHFNGSRWSIVPCPSTNATQPSELLSVVSINSTDIWAVGYYTNDQGNVQTLAEQYNGVAWEIVPTPNTSASTANQLMGISGISATDIWAVGYEQNVNTGSNDQIALNWNGSTWNATSIPSINPMVNVQLDAVVALTANDVWASGYYTNANSQGNETLVEHWNGSSWNAVTTSIGDAEQDNQANAITSLGQSNVATSQILSRLNADNIPALGSDGTVLVAGGSGGGPLAGLWNGSAFAEYPPLLNDGLTASSFSAVDELTSDSYWFVGNGENSQNNMQGLIVHYGEPVSASAPPPTPKPVVTGPAKPKNSGKLGSLILLIVLIAALGAGWVFWKRYQES